MLIFKNVRMAHHKLFADFVTDIVKDIDRYPEIGTLSNISSVSRSVGGSVPNVGIDLSVIDPAILDGGSEGGDGKDAAENKDEKTAESNEAEKIS